MYIDLDNNNNNIWSAKQINVNVIIDFFTNVQSGENKISTIKEGLLLSLFRLMQWKRNNNIQMHQYKYSANIEKFSFSCREMSVQVNKHHPEQ